MRKEEGVERGMLWSPGAEDDSGEPEPRAAPGRAGPEPREWRGWLSGRLRECLGEASVGASTGPCPIPRGGGAENPTDKVSGKKGRRGGVCGQRENKSSKFQLKHLLLDTLQELIFFYYNLIFKQMFT